MRTIEQIKKEITDAWMADANLRAAYGMAEGASWESTFSKVGFENLFVYIMASAIWVHEKLFEAHRTDVTNYISTMKPHTLRWYVAKAKLYRAGQSLIDGTDKYNDEGLTNEEIAALQPVKFAAATEISGAVYIKVASDSRTPITAEQAEGLNAYFAEIKDAGVQVEIINREPTALKLSLTVHYNAMVLDNTGTNLATGETAVKDAIKNYISNLPFNGEFRISELVDILQKVDGVVIPTVTAASEQLLTDEWQEISIKSIPYSGYYAYDENNIDITYEAYDLANRL